MLFRSVLGRNLTEAEREAIRASEVRAISIYEELPEMASLLIDDEQGGRLAADYLWSRGFRKVSMLFRWMGPRDRIGWNGRVHGFRQRAQELGLEVREIEVAGGLHVRQHLGYYDAVPPEMLQRILEGGEAGRCVYCASDWLAIPLVHHADRLGLKLGEEFSVMGFDNVEGQFEQPWDQPRLTTIHRPRDEVGRMAARLAMDFNCKLEGLVHRFPVHLVERSSVGFGPACRSKKRVGITV